MFGNPAYLDGRFGMDSVLILLVGVLLGLYNGQFITEKSKSWHLTGFLIRVVLFIVLIPNLLLMAWYGVIVWPVYNIIINLYMRQPWHYQGTTAWFDRNIPKGLNLTLQGLVIIFAVLITYIYSNIKI